MDDDRKFLRITVAEYREIINSLADKKVIQAIKQLRNSTGEGLRVSKLAIDRLRHEKFDYKHQPGPEAMKIVTGPEIINVTLDYGDGPVELNIEGMQLRALTELQYIGVEQCSEMLKLVDIFRAISDGREISIVDDEYQSA